MWPEMTGHAAPNAKESPGRIALLYAARYTLTNLEAASRAHLITAPLWFQAQLGESRRLLREAIDQHLVRGFCRTAVHPARAGQSQRAPTARAASRFTPAHAGQTFGLRPDSVTQAGSPPRMRGKLAP